jgi:hypothetical protein
VARRGRFNLVLGAAEGMVLGAGTEDRLDYAMLPGPRYTVLRLRDGGSQTPVQIWPRLRVGDRFDVDREMTSSERLDVTLPSRRQPALPLSPASVTECLNLLRWSMHRVVGARRQRRRVDRPARPGAPGACRLVADHRHHR